ncbi:hypothetical protein F5X96DRAFT_350767 [Biscogniauxia mediterranea]|nr:hypothetical protein F5X96DRAFT_350767 [Biscogniauxia mediterranea]
MASTESGRADSAENKQPELGGIDDETVAAIDSGIQVNAAGYKDQLKRQYGLLGIVGVALTVDNAWAALGSSISVSILNGGPPGLIFGLIVALFYYSFIGLSLAEVCKTLHSSPSLLLPIPDINPPRLVQSGF